MAKKRTAPKPPKKAKKAATPKPAAPAPAPAAPKPAAPVKPSKQDFDDLLGLSEPQPAAAPKAATGIENADYKFHADAKPVKLAKCRHSLGGEVHLYDRTKGAPVDVKLAAGMRWFLMHVPSGMRHFMEKKRPARKLMAQAAKGVVKELTPDGATVVTETRGRKAAPPVPGATAPQPAGVPDEDFNKKSEGPHPVPSVWQKGSRYGLLVYCGRSRARMISGEDGKVEVHKIGVGLLATPSELQKLLEQTRASTDDKEQAALVKTAEQTWVRSTSGTPEHYATLMVASQLEKTPAARAYLDRILGAMDDLLAGKRAEEEDLLS